jgi:hypothetical protein
VNLLTSTIKKEKDFAIVGYAEVCGHSPVPINLKIEGNIFGSGSDPVFSI